MAAKRGLGTPEFDKLRVQIKGYSGILGESPARGHVLPGA